MFSVFFVFSLYYLLLIYGYGIFLLFIYCFLRLICIYLMFIRCLFQVCLHLSKAYYAYLGVFKVGAYFCLGA